MNRTKLELNLQWTEQKLALIRQHHAERQRCFALEDESWRSLEHQHCQQRNELEAAPFDVLKRKQLIRQQLQDIQGWRETVARNRWVLRAYQEEENNQLEAIKRALST